MSDDATQRASELVQNETGYRRDLREAESLIVIAGNDPVKLAIAFRRHSEAVRNMMLAEMIPSFQKALKPLLDDALTPVVSGIGGLQAGVTDLNSEFRTLSEQVDDLVRATQEGKEDRLRIKTELAAVKEEVATLRSAFNDYQKGNKRNEIVTMQQQIADLQSNFTPEERTRLITVLLAMISAYETEHGNT